MSIKCSQSKQFLIDFDLRKSIHTNSWCWKTKITSWI